MTARFAVGYAPVMPVEPHSSPPASDGPRHVALIMDGNGRWAQARGLPRAMGHREGVQALKRTVQAAPALGIRCLTVFGFSTENWRRPRIRTLTPSRSSRFRSLAT